jgi:CO/xanthine dehydrogenase Mo-binding subunit
MRILLDGGAYAPARLLVSNASPPRSAYRVDTLIEGRASTNNPPCGAMRGFGAVQTCFAAEAQMDLLAEELHIDPVELRLLNAIEPGDQLPTGQVLTGSMPVAQVIREAAAIPVPEAEPLPRDPIRLPGGAGNTTRGEGVRRGVGFAVGFKNSATRRLHDPSPPRTIPAGGRPGAAPLPRSARGSTSSPRRARFRK